MSGGIYMAASGALGAASPEQLAKFIADLNQVYQDVLARGEIPTGVLLAVGVRARVFSLTVGAD